MPAPLNRNLPTYRIALGACIGLALILALQFFVLARPKPVQIKLLHRDIKALQERLISAQITSRNLEQVQGLIRKNLAFSASDTMAQGASLNFLTDLHRVLDNQRITVVTLEPRPVRKKGRFIETPYDLEILCDYAQFSNLADKMEKSPRLISITEFEMDNSIEAYFADGSPARTGQCKVKMQITTLTLVRKG